MKKALGVVLILLSLPLLAWSIAVEFVYLGEARGKFNTHMTTAEEKYFASKEDAEKKYNNKKETIVKNYNEQLSALNGQAKIEFEKTFKETEKTFDDMYVAAIKLREETYENVKTQYENAFKERVSQERVATYSIHCGIVGVIFLVIGIFSILKGRKKLTSS